MGKKTHRPWGWFEILKKDEDYWVKKIVVHPGCKLSLQYHRKRTEFWYVVSGKGVFIKGNPSLFASRKYVGKNDNITISPKEIHRIVNNGKRNFVIIEFAVGKPEEEDIIRIQDDYGRIDE